MVDLGFFKRKKDSAKKPLQSKEWPDYVVSLDKESFNEFIERYPLSVIDFWAPWCNPCKTMSPRVRRLSKIYKGKVAFGKLNTQENQDITKQYKIMGIPHLAFFHYGKKVMSITGVRSVGGIKDTIDDLLKKH
jgi:thioredoxin 1